MTFILRFILFFFLALAFAIVAQGSGAVEDCFRIVDAGFQPELVLQESAESVICTYDSSGALLQQRRSIDGRAADEDCLSSIGELKTSGLSQPLFSFLVELVAARTTPTPSGQITWPPNRGFVAGEGGRASVLPGQTLDRFGGPGGSFLSPAGTPASARSLAPGGELRQLHSYEVLRPFEAGAGRASPWFNQPGGGLQFDLGTQTVQDLVNAGILRPIP